MNKYKSLLGDSIVFGIGNFVTKLIYFFLMPIYTTTLSPSDFGIADLLSNSLSLITPIFTLSIADAVFRFVLDKDAHVSKIISCGGNVLVKSSIFLLSVVSLVYLFTHTVYWLLFGVLYATEASRLLFANFTRGIGKSKVFALNGIIGALTLIVASFVTLKTYNLGINGYLVSFIIANLISVVYLFIASKIYNYISFKKVDSLLFKEMLAYCLPQIPNMLSWWFTNISSRYIIAGYCGLTFAGLFSAAGKLPAMINVMGSIFQQAWQYVSVREYQESNQSTFYTIVFRVYSCVIIICSSLIIIFIPYISRLVLKDNFYEAWIYTPLLLFSAMLGCFSLFLGTFYAVVKDNKKAMHTTMIGSIVSMGLCFLLIPLIGVYGALIANVLGFGIIVYLRFIHVRKMVTLEINYVSFISSVIVVLIISILTTLNFAYSLYICLALLCAIIFILSNDLKFVTLKTISYLKR